MKAKTIGFIVGLIVVLVLGFFIFNNPSNQGLTGNAIKDQEQSANSVKPDQMGATTKTFAVTGENFKFVINGETNPDMHVKLGDRVKIEFKSSKGFHDWVLDEFNAKTEQVRDGGSSTVEFVADKKGTFEYYCSVGEHRMHGMKGKFIVE